METSPLQAKMTNIAQHSSKNLPAKPNKQRSLAEAKLGPSEPFQQKGRGKISKKAAERIGEREQHQCHSFPLVFQADSPPRAGQSHFKILEESALKGHGFSRAEEIQR